MPQISKISKIFFAVHHRLFTVLVTLFCVFFIFECFMSECGGTENYVCKCRKKGADNLLRETAIPIGLFNWFQPSKRRQDNSEE